MEMIIQGQDVEGHTESSATGSLVAHKSKTAEETLTRSLNEVLEEHPVLERAESSLESDKTTPNSEKNQELGHTVDESNKMTSAAPPLAPRNLGSTWSATPTSARSVSVQSDRLSQASTAIVHRGRVLRPARPTAHPERYAASPGSANTPLYTPSMETSAEDVHGREKRAFRERAKRKWLQNEERKREERKREHNIVPETRIYPMYPFHDEEESRRRMNPEHGPSDIQHTYPSYSSPPYVLMPPWHYHVPYIPPSPLPLITSAPALASGRTDPQTPSIQSPIHGRSRSPSSLEAQPHAPSPAVASSSAVKSPAAPDSTHPPPVAPSLAGPTQSIGTSPDLPEPSRTIDPIELVETYLEALKDKKEKELVDASRILSWIAQRSSPLQPPGVESFRDDDESSDVSTSHPGLVATSSVPYSTLTRPTSTPTTPRVSLRREMELRRRSERLLERSTRISMSNLPSDTMGRLYRPPCPVQQAESASTLDYSCAVSELDTSSVDVKIDPATAETDRLHRTNILRQDVAAMQNQIPSNNQTWVKQILVSTWSHLKKLMRQSPRSGTQRLEWTCECGNELWADFPIADLKTLQEMREFLTNTGTNAQSRPNGYDQSPADLESGTPRSSYASHRSGQRSLNSIPHAPPSTVGSGSTFVGSSGSQSFVLPTSNLFAQSKYLEICVNVDNYETKLAEIQIIAGVSDNASICTDAHLFRKIYDRYFATTKSMWRRFLYRPTGIKFVHFGVQSEQRVNFFSGSQLPPEDLLTSKQYEYNLQPPVPPPIDSRTFLHYFWKHGKHSHSTSARYVDRLPKKLGDSLLRSLGSDELREGWGIHILEGPNKPVICWILLVVLVGSFGIALGYDLIMKNGDSGFGIGQWMVAALTVALSALYFSLEDEVNTSYD
ncbi:hypothetical protein BDV96DRAFT_574857 [Lophiotrema nucula]|uniref:Uncharacterized protein n=1 Tax=Lophiotrema nucula TaxID=690887 RepID=A0A6A5ZC19_9PLEO|nr:hypothetical protein BDV96DRAFT_574857 [Lophiotrema nucula]